MSDQTINQGNQRATERWSLLGAVVGAIAASICCLGPLVLLTLGVGGAWASSLTALEPYRPLFIIMAVAFLGFGFYRAYRKPVGAKCGPNGSCAVPRAKRINRIALWIITPLILALLAFPYFAPRLFAQDNSIEATYMNAEQAVLNVQGMTCAACTANVRRSLMNVEGVQDAKVTLDPPHAVVNYDPAKTSVAALTQATAEAGYPSSVEPQQ